MEQPTAKPAVTHTVEQPTAPSPTSVPASLVLRRSPRSDTYCVPAALALLTGLHVDTVIELIKDEIGEQPISGIFYPLALKILLKLGYQFLEVPNYQFGLCLICFQRHVGVWYSGKYYDNQNPEGTNRGTPRMRIEKIFRVWKES